MSLITHFIFLFLTTNFVVLSEKRKTKIRTEWRRTIAESSTGRKEKKRETQDHYKNKGKERKKREKFEEKEGKEGIEEKSDE